MVALGESHRDRQTIGGEAVQGLCPQHRPCMLWVDDDELIAAMGRHMLVRLGVEVVAHTCSLKALRAFQAAPQGFDFVLTDLDMPDMTGAALAGQLWQIRPATPIILCTGSPTMTWEKAQRLGFGFLLTKPFCVADLVVAIEQIFPRRMAWVS